MTFLGIGTDGINYFTICSGSSQNSSNSDLRPSHEAPVGYTRPVDHRDQRSMTPERLHPEEYGLADDRWVYNLIILSIIMYLALQDQISIFSHNVHIFQLLCWSYSGIFSKAFS